jgi:hypothetical protein
MGANAPMSQSEYPLYTVSPSFRTFISSLIAPCVLPMSMPLGLHLFLFCKNLENYLTNSMRPCVLCVYAYCNVNQHMFQTSNHSMRKLRKETFKARPLLLKKTTIYMTWIQAHIIAIPSLSSWMVHARMYSKRYKKC